MKKSVLVALGLLYSVCGHAEVVSVEIAMRAPVLDGQPFGATGAYEKLAGKIEFDVPEANRESLGGIQSGAVEFSVEFSNVNGGQAIEAPARARPLSALTQSLGGAGALPGLGGGNGSEPTTPSVPEGATPEAQDFQEYAECLDKARPEDTEALQRCADLLQRP